MLEIAIYINLFISLLISVLMGGMFYVAYLDYKRKKRKR